MTRITTTGRNHTWTAPISSMQRERMEPETLLPMEAEFTGKHRALTWGACLVVSALASMAFFAWVFG